MSFGQAVIALLRDTRDAMVAIVERRWGIVRAYIEDVRDNIRFEDSRIDSIVFNVNIPIGGVIVVQPGVQRIHPEYLFAMRRIQAYAQDPAGNAVNLPLITFTVRESGRGQDVFLTPQNLASLIPGGGSDHMEWDTPYVFREAAEIQVNFAVTAPAAFVGGPMIVGVVLLGDLVRKKILP